LLLVKTKFVVPGSFGGRFKIVSVHSFTARTFIHADIGGTLYGPWMRYAILGSIVISQIGFVAAYTIFVSENLQVRRSFTVLTVHLSHTRFLAQAFVMGVTHCAKLIPSQYFITLQMLILLPLALFRDIAKLSSAALVADAFILAGLIYIFGTEASIISRDGIADVKLFNPESFPLFIG
jgi:proton-coupled amino acid transporter